MPRLVGVLADVHGDIFALDAALARLHQMGCNPILCTGDLIEMEPFGEEVIQRLKSEKNVICIKGNHERWALERRRRRKDVRGFFEPCNIADYVGGGIDLSREALAWLATLPGHWEGELEGIRVMRMEKVSAPTRAAIGKASWRASAWRCGTPDRAATWRAW